MYIVFAFDEHYPCGGVNDIELQTESIEDAVDKAVELTSNHRDGPTYDFSQVYSVNKQEIVWESCED